MSLCQKLLLGLKVGYMECRRGAELPGSWGASVAPRKGIWQLWEHFWLLGWEAAMMTHFVWLSCRWRTTSDSLSPMCFLYKDTTCECVCVHSFFRCSEFSGNAAIMCIKGDLFSTEPSQEFFASRKKKLLLRHGAAWRVERGLNVWPHLALAAG